MLSKDQQYTFAKQLGTPLYLFDLDVFASRCNKIKQAFGEQIALCYSIKANPFLLVDLPECIQALEVCSPGELSICMKMHMPPASILYSGINKTEADLARAIAYGVERFSAESLEQLRLINLCAARANKRLRVLLRLSAKTQFGVDEETFLQVCRSLTDYSHLDLCGLHFFSGTQKKKGANIIKELEYLDAFCARVLSETGFSVTDIEYGTGLPIDYFGADAESTEIAILQEIAPAIRALGARVHLTIEMGRFFAAPCGTYLTKVVDTKTNYGIHYAICDGGMHQIKYYGQIQGMQIPPIARLTPYEQEADPAKEWTVCGSICTTADVLARKAPIGELAIGDTLAFGRVGAYSVMEGSALFLSRELPRVALYSEACGLSLVRDFFETNCFNMPFQN